MYLGAKHMVTGYDHLAFLVGVIFFLYRMKDIVQYVSLFTVGHSLTLLVGVLGGVRANPYIVDAIIGFSVVYKAFDNMDGFKRFFGFQPNTRAAVLIFGLFHGFGLATKLQDFALSPNGLVANIVSFNVGVEIGQVVALTFVLLVLELLADPQRISSARVRDQRGPDGLRVSPGRLSGVRLLPGGVMETNSENGRAGHHRAGSASRVAAGAALLMAGLILVIAVLPAEYGVDPLGIGRRLGLTAMSDVAKQRGRVGGRPGSWRRRRQPTIAPQDRAYQRGDGRFHRSGRGAFMEYKYRLEKGEALLYSWKATGAGQRRTFMRSPTARREAMPKATKRKTASTRASGTMTAPFSGIHGWYWQNQTSADVTVTLAGAGFFKLSHEFREGQPAKNKTFQ